MARSIQEGKYRTPHAAAVAFAGPPELPSFDRDKTRLYRKYRIHREGLALAIQAEQAQDTEKKDIYRAVGEILAGRTDIQKYNILRKFLAINRANGWVLRALEPLTGEEFTAVQAILHQAAKVEMSQAGIDEKTGEALQEVVKAVQEPTEFPEEEENT